MPQISLARPADLPDILSMIRALSKFHGDEAKVDLATLQDIFFGVAPRATALIARSADQALGYAGLTPTTVCTKGPRDWTSTISMSAKPIAAKASARP